MSNISLIAKIANLAGVSKSVFGNGKSKVGEIIIDCTHETDIEYSNNVTQHPTERGYVSDHIFKNDNVITIKGSITDTPADIFGVVQKVQDFFSGDILTNAKNQFFNKSTRQISCYEALRDMHESKALIDVVTYWDTFSNLAILNLKFPRDANTGGRLYFEMTLKQITFADVEYSDISHNSRKVQDSLSNKVNLGKTQTTQATSDQKRSATLLASAAKNIKSLWGN